MVVIDYSPFFESQKRHGKHLFAAPIRPPDRLAAAAILFYCGSHRKWVRQPVKTAAALIFFFKALPDVRQYIYNRYSATHAEL